MRTFIHGTDKGNVVVTAMVLIIVLSTVFLSFIPRISAIKHYAKEYKSRILLSIEQSNKEIMNSYDAH